MPAIRLFCLLLLCSFVPGYGAGLSAAAELHYTVQLGSFPDQAGATAAFQGLLHRHGAANLPELRVEKVGRYYALRVGRYDHYRDAAGLRDRLGAGLVLEAYILAERTVLALPDTTTPEEPPARSQVEGPAQPPAATPPALPVTPAVGPAAPPPPAEPAGPTTTPPAPPPPPAAAAPPPARETQETTPPPTAKEQRPATPAATTETAPPPPAKKPRPLEVTPVLQLTEDDLGSPLAYPQDVFTDPPRGESYVLSGGRARVVIYNREFYPIASFGGGRDIEAPVGGVVDRHGNVLLLQARTGNLGPNLSVYNGAFYPVTKVPFATMEGAGSFVPANVAAAPDGTVYVAGQGGPGVLTLKPDYSFRSWLPVHDRLYDQLRRSPTPLAVPIRDVVVDDDGARYFLAEETGKVYVYDNNENFLFAFGTKGGSMGKLSRPRALAVSLSQRVIYVVDYMRHTVLLYDLNGRFVDEFGGLGWGAKWFNYPTHVAFLPPDLVLVADNFNQRVQVLRVRPPDGLPAKDPARWHTGQGTAE